MQLADQIPDPVRRAVEKAAFCARYGDVEGQGNYLREAYQLKPDNPVVVDRLMNYAILRQDWNLAEECLQAATKSNLDRFEGKIFASRLAIAKGEFFKAIDDLTQVVTKEPDAKLPWLMLGDCYNQIGDFEKAEKTFLTLVKVDPGYIPALVAMAMVTEREGKTAEHAGWIERAYRLAPNNPYVQQRYLMILEGKASSEELITQRERLQKQNPSDMYNRYQLGRLYEKTHQEAKAEEVYRGLYADSSDKLAAGRVLAGFLSRNHRLDEAEKVMNELLQSSPDKVVAYLVYADYLVEVNPNQARAAVAKAIEIAPQDPRGYRALASLLSRREDWAGAADALAKYLELQPDNASAAKELIRCRLEADQLPQAEQQLNTLLAASPSDPDLLTMKGNLAIKQGKVDQGLELFERAVQIAPNHVGALLGQAHALLTLGRTSEAKMAMIKAKDISNDPELAMALEKLHTQLGDTEMAVMVLREVLNRPETADYAPAMREMVRIYERQQRWTKVAELLAEAKTKFPTDPYFLLIEGRMYHFNGNSAKAIASLEAALKLAPESREVLREYLLTLVEAGDYNKVLAVTDSYKDKPSCGMPEMSVRAGAGQAESARTGRPLVP